MPYSQFTTIGKVKAALLFAVWEGLGFLPSLPSPIAPSDVLAGTILKAACQLWQYFDLRYGNPQSSKCAIALLSGLGKA
ncbi:MAG TPA: hypothetical protein VK211_21195 [Kamptonema sp.]|nr:hypothetical protein [Kamptonema sp.]